MKIYNYDFHNLAKKEWDKLNATIQAQFKKQLIKRLAVPYVPSTQLSKDLESCYKIKLRSSRFRLVYEVIEKRIKVIAIAVGKRDKGAAYAQAEKCIVYTGAKK